MKALNIIESWLSILILMVIIVLMSVEIITRYLLGFSFSTSEELSRYLFIWFVYISMSYAITKESHITIDSLYNAVPSKFKFLFKQIGIIAWILFAVAFTYFSTQYVFYMYETGSRAGASNIPLWIISLGIPFGFLLSIFRLIFIFFKNLSNAEN